ncbi:hypothetical protein ACFQ6V_13800 [Streptomyces roseifaciens]
MGRRPAAHMKDRARAAGLSGVRVVSHPPSEGSYRSVGARRVGTVAAALPKITWERPVLEFALG